MMTATKPGAQLPFAGAGNFRDLGGYPTVDGRRVRRGLLFRGGCLDALQSGADQALLQSLHLREILDLRSAGEAAAHPDPPLPGAHYRRLCGMCYPDGGEMDYSPRGIERLNAEKAAFERAVGHTVHDFDWFCALYRKMPFGNAAYKELFSLLENHRVPLLFHCTCGKDRTGIAAMLILLALGVSRRDAVTDYLLTNVYRRPVIEGFLHNKPKTEWALLLPVEGVSRKMGEGALDAILEKYPDYDSYFAAEFGLTPDRLAALRAFYLEG